MLLRIFGEEAAKRRPWIAGQGLSIAGRLSACNDEGVERIASHIRIASKRLVLCGAIEESQIRPIHERSHRRSGFNPAYFSDVH